MQSTAPSPNDVGMLSSTARAVASLATPAPSLREETPREETEQQYLWRCIPDYVWSQREIRAPSEKTKSAAEKKAEKLKAKD
ncbi:hypothetical protein FDECE_18218 [Fusarium decemcellulare]|nr:hypothetical protein FDECE_18218 [Fusarium decemcellulare]